MKKYQIEITAPAEADLAETVRYVARELREPTAALRLLRSIVEAVESLEQMPYRYPLANDEYLSKAGIRILPVKKYLIFYTADDQTETVTVVRILYARRDWINLLKLDL